MMELIRAIYHNGLLHLLEPVNLAEGQEVQLQIVQVQTPLKDLLSDMLVTFDHDESEIDEVNIVQQIDQALMGKRPLSAIILEDR